MITIYLFFGAVFTAFLLTHTPWEEIPKPRVVSLLVLILAWLPLFAASSFALYQKKRNENY